MARGVLAFTKDGRHRVAGVLRALLIAQLVVSLALLIFCYNASHKVMALLKDIHKVLGRMFHSNGSMMPPHQVTVILLHGLVILQVYAMKLHYTSGLRLITWLLKYPHWARADWVCRIWLISGSLIAANGLVVYRACNGTLKALNKELSSSLRVGISQYLTEPTWKRLLDTMQVELGCCGAENPSDWHEIPWINMDFLNENSSVVMKLAGTDGKVLPPVSPYSCCTPRVLAACYHDPLQQSEWREGWSEGSPLLTASLHARGCVEAVRAPLTRSLLALRLLNVLIALFQVLIVVLTRLLHSSAQDAVLNGDYEGIGEGHLFRRGPRQPIDRRGDSETSLVEGGSSCALLARPRRRRRRARPDLACSWHTVAKARI